MKMYENIKNLKLKVIDFFFFFLNNSSQLNKLFYDKFDGKVVDYLIF